MREIIGDVVRNTLNHPFFQYLVGIPLLEFGLSRWGNRSFSKRNVWTLFIIAYAIGCVLRGLYLVQIR